jgi:hypothetical protein
MMSLNRKSSPKAAYPDRATMLTITIRLRMDTNLCFLDESMRRKGSDFPASHSLKSGEKWTSLSVRQLFAQNGLQL